MATCITIFSRFSNLSSSRSLLTARTSIICYQQCMTLKTKDFQKLGIVPPPKKPLVTFFRFKQMVYPKLKEMNPKLKVTDLMKLISSEWENYPLEKKEVLQKEYQAEKIKFDKDFEEYKKSISFEQEALIEGAKQELRYSKEFRIRRQKRKELEKPKRPASPYGIYFRDKKLTRQESESKLDFMKRLGNEWRLLSFEQKKKYHEAFLKLKREYVIKLKEWEEKMIKSGNLDVIGTKTLRKLDAELKEKQEVGKYKVKKSDL